jgi:hypothetical protein
MKGSDGIDLPARLDAAHPQLVAGPKTLFTVFGSITQM